MGYDGFHPKVHLELTKETSGEIVEFLEVEQRGKWPQEALHDDVHLDSEDTLVGSYDGTRSGEMAAEVSC